VRWNAGLAWSFFSWQGGSARNDKVAVCLLLRHAVLPRDAIMCKSQD
jgi:hypothetical protein